MTTFTRRLQKIGSSILVSLPKEWIDANNLDKSAQVEIETMQNNLSITTHQSTKPTKEIEIHYPISKEESVFENVNEVLLENIVNVFGIVFGKIALASASRSLGVMRLPGAYLGLR